MAAPVGESARPFPEIDRLAYFDGAEALIHILPSQAPLIAEVLSSLGVAA